MVSVENWLPDSESRIWVAARAAIPVAAGDAVSTSAQVQRGSQGVVVSMGLVSQIAGAGPRTASTVQSTRTDPNRWLPSPTQKRACQWPGVGQWVGLFQLNTTLPAGPSLTVAS